MNRQSLVIPHLSGEQLRVLRHMLGIDEPSQREPVPYRDYYCAKAGKAELHELARIGAVRLYRQDGSYDWYCTTDVGRAAAMASHRQIRLPKGKRLYRKFLDIRDALPDIDFKAFLTEPRFSETRRSA